MVAIVLIAGESGSGKTTIAKLIVKLLPECQLFHQDHYFTTPFLAYAQRTDASYEDGSAVDWGQLQKDMEASVKDGIENDAIFLVEGHMLGVSLSTFLQAFNATASLVVVPIHCSQDVCKARRLNRRERSEEEWEELSAYIDKYVWPSFVKFGLPAMRALSNSATENPERQIRIVELSADADDSLAPNVEKVLEAILSVMQDRESKPQGDVLEEEWPSISDKLHGFAEHHQLTTRLHHKEDVTFQLECVTSLTPLDMMHLSQGAHDATGSSVWMGAFNLIEALASNVTYKNPSGNEADLPIGCVFRSKQVLELGCGTGVGGLSLLLAPKSSDAQPSHICFTDNDDAVLDLCRRNCEKNGLLSETSCDARCSFAHLDWGTVQDSTLFDTVLATDVLYDLACLGPLLSTVAQSLQPSGSFVLAHVPRSCLPDSLSATANGDCDYHASLEAYIVQTAGEHGLKTIAIIRPGEIRSAQGGGDASPLNETSLSEMEDAGAAILLFKKEQLNEQQGILARILPDET